MPFNDSEALVQQLCNESFFRLWSVANPMFDASRELCDVIVVFGDNVLLWSVKDISYRDTGSAVGFERWQREAIEKSIAQLKRAERRLQRLSAVSASGAVAPLVLPPPDRRRVFRIAVALGSRGEVPIYESGTAAAHFHVMEEAALQTVLKELNTISDFVHYLDAKEKLLASTQVVHSGGEGDLLGIYLHNGRRFPDSGDLLILEDDIWAGVTSKPEWEARKKADEVSYVWDRLIEFFVADYEGTPVPERVAAQETERILRVLASESRFNRRILGESFEDFMRAATAKTTRARIAKSPSGIVYVFVATDRNEERKSRVAEITARCWVARGLNLDSRTVVGIGTEAYVGRPGFSFDAVLLHIEQWEKKHQSQMDYLQKELGFFKNPVFSQQSYLEYPGSDRIAPDS